MAWYQAGLPLDTTPIEATYQDTAFTELTPTRPSAGSRRGPT